MEEPESGAVVNVKCCEMMDLKKTLTKGGKVVLFLEVFLRKNVYSGR